MIIQTLQEVVEKNDINTVEVFVGEGVSPLSFDVDSQEYRDQEKFLITGEYQIRQDHKTGKYILKVEGLEEELEKEEDTSVIAQTEGPEEIEEGSDEKLDEFINTEITAVVFNRNTLASAGRETKRKFILAYAESVIESFRKNFGEADNGEFAIVEIDWDNRTVSLKSLPEEVIEEEEGDTIGEE